MRLPEIMRRTGLSKSGVGAFCYSIDLLTLKNRREGRAVLESRFFQAIDSKGKTALDFYWSAALRGSVMSAAPISPSEPKPDRKHHLAPRRPDHPSQLPPTTILARAQKYVFRQSELELLAISPAPVNRRFRRNLE
jgi:hypothetical protein